MLILAGIAEQLLTECYDLVGLLVLFEYFIDTAVLPVFSVFYGLCVLADRLSSFYGEASPVI